jgi:nitroreductase
MLKRFLIRVVPRPLLNRAKGLVVTFQLSKATLYDARRYRKFSSSVTSLDSKHNLAAMITERYHSIEKGLSLPQPRQAFGARALSDLLKLTDEYRKSYGDDRLTRTVGAVLDAYLAFNADLGVDPLQVPSYVRIHALLRDLGPLPVTAGTRQVMIEDIRSATDGVDLSFFESRYSVRQFSSAPVSKADIEFATLAAQKSPAVCNRQFGKVYAYTDRSEISRLLSIQGGANGFGEGLTGLAVITTNLRSYWNDGQRNQAWVDGGLFAMSFMLGLHARGLGAIALNWSKGPARDQLLRLEADIPQDEVIIMFVGFGNLKDEFRVASSPRLPLNEALTFPEPRRG